MEGAYIRNTGRLSNTVGQTTRETIASAVPTVLFYPVQRHSILKHVEGSSNNPNQMNYFNNCGYGIAFQATTLDKETGNRRPEILLNAYALFRPKIVPKYEYELITNKYVPVNWHALL